MELNDWLTILGAIGGSSTLTWLVTFLFTRRTAARKNDAEADSAEFNVLRETMVFLQEQLKNKEQRFAEQTNLVRTLNTENLSLSKRVSELEATCSLKLCNRRGCSDREPQSGY